MGGVRPITDFWILARCKHGYYGGYPAGFLERARDVLCGGRLEDPIWHIPGGMAHKYNGAGGMPLSGYGPNDVRIDLSKECEPDILMDIRELHKILVVGDSCAVPVTGAVTLNRHRVRPSSIIIDLPYTEEDAEKYEPGSDKLPNLNDTLRECLRIVKPGGLVGVLDYKWPNGKRFGAKCIFVANVSTGEGSNARFFTVWKKIKT